MAGFARCPACQTICGFMLEAEAQSGGWRDVLDPTCLCGKAAEHLVPVGENEAVLAMEAGMVPLLVLVSDG